jgi:hypothetical protein
MRRFVLIIALILTCSPVLGSAAAVAPAHDPSFDLAAVVLTAADLERAGFTGYRIDTASPFERAADAAYVSEYQNLDLERVTQSLADAGEQGSYFTESSIRTDENDRTSQPVRGIETGAFLFAGDAGAKAGYKLITDQSHLDNATDLDAGKGLGDASEMTLLTLHKDPVYGIPTTQLQLEIRIGRLVLTLSTFDFEPATAGTSNYKPDEPANLEALGNLFIDRANAALAGKSPGLAPLLLPVDVSVDQRPYRIYNLLDSDPIQESFESDQDVQDRLSDQLDHGLTSTLFNGQLLQSADASTGEFWLYTSIFQYENAAKAKAYLQNLVDKMNQDSQYSSVDVAATPDLGDEALILDVGYKGDSGDKHLNELYMRSGATVVIFWITANPLLPGSPTVSVDAIEQLGAAEAQCLETGFCDASVPLPDEVIAMMNGSSPDATPAGKSKLPQG